MRICMVFQADFPPAERIEKIVKTLAAARHEVVLLCNNYGGFAPGPEPVGDVTVLRVKPTFRRRAINRILKFPVFLNPLWVAQLFWVARRFHIEALQVIDLPLAGAALFVARCLRIPVVMDMWENYPEALRGWARENWKTRVFKNPRVARAVELFVTPRMNHIFTVVDEQKERLIRDGVAAGKVSVVTNAVDIGLFTGGAPPLKTALDEEPPDAYKLLYVGKIEIERGLEDIVRALRLVRPHIPNVRFFIAGDGTYEARLQKIVEEEGVADLVRFLGFLRFDQIHAYVAKSDLCIVPHVNNEFINTTIPNKLFQYMAMAKPILVSNAKPLARIVRAAGCGFVFESGNPSSAAAAIRQACESRFDPKIGASGRECVDREYTWEKVSAPLIEVYATLSKKMRDPVE